MEPERSNIAQDAKDLDAEGRRWLEHLLGRQLRDDERVYVMTTIIRDPTERRQALGQIKQSAAEVEASLKQRGISPDELDAALEEACDAVRHRKEG